MSRSVPKGDTGERSSSDSAQSNLPSRLTPMEQLHLLRDSDAYPNVIVGRLILEGEIDRELYERALQFVTDRHEMMFARLSSNKKTWQPNPSAEPRSEVRWHESEYDQNQHEIEPVRLSSSSGFRCDVFVGSNNVNLFFQIHHAKADGLGAIQGIRETLQAYDNLCNQRAIDDGLRRLNPERFTKRGQIGLFQKGWWRRAFVQWIPVYGTAKFALAKITHLLPDWKVDERPAPLKNYLTYIRRKFEPRVMELLRTGGRSANDRLLAGLFLTVDRFQNEINQDRGTKKIRIIVPINIRERSDLRGTLCNRTALIQLDRGEKDFADTQGLIWGINYELGIVGKFKFEKSFAIALRLMSTVPSFFRWRVKRRSIGATTLLTNLGNPFRNLKLPRHEGSHTAGNMKLVDVELIPPVDDLLPAVFLFSTHEGVPAITINYDQRVISAQQAERLMEIYLEEIRRIVDEITTD